MKGRLSQGAATFVVTLVVASTVNRLVNGQLTQVSRCTCPGDTVVYTCSVTGTGFTIWRGSAFYCPSAGSQILLSHSLFGGAGASGSCNGALSGRSIGVSGSVYTSQLTVNLAANSSLIGERIECVHRSNSVETTIGSMTIQLADPLPPPSNVQLADISPSLLAFSWRPLEFACPSLQYRLSSNCGSCMNDLTTQTSITCAIEQSTIVEKQCHFSVQTLICGNRAGVLSERINLTLKVPEPPRTSTIQALPYYNASNQRLLMLDILFDKLDEFFISDGVDGSAFNYTITYTDSETNTLCDSLTIDPNQSCCKEMCTVPSFDPVPCSQMVNDGVIDIAISATNVLGNGPPSNIQADYVNRVVRVTFESDTRIVCTFLQQSSSKSCSIDYGECGLQLSTMRREGQATSSDVVEIDLSLENVQSSVYCYTVNASSNGTHAFVTGTRIRDSYNNNSGPNVAAIVLGLFMAVFVILLIAAGVIIVLLIVFLKCPKLAEKYIVKGKSTASEPQPYLGNMTEAEMHLLSNTSSNSSSRRESIDLSSNVGVTDSSARLRRSADMRTLSSGRVSADSLAPRIVSAHLKFNVEDKPQEVVKALKKLKDVGINIKNIWHSPCSDGTESKVSLKTIYIEWENDSTVDRSGLQNMKLGYGKSLEVVSDTQPENHIIDNYKDSDHVKIELKVCLKHQPGALAELLEFIYSLKGWKHINLTDIEIFLTKSPNEGPRRCRNVILKFQSTVSQGWKDMFDRGKQKCSAIIQTEEHTATAV